MKILVTGANGFLGQHLTLYLAAKNNCIVYATGRGDCKIPPNKNYTYSNIELTNKQQVIAAITSMQPNFIIHTAAMSKPDECNNEQEKCLLNNVTATEYLVQAANMVQAKIIYTSTDFIFGENGPHAEDAIPEPLNFYGHSKLLAEKLVQQQALQYAIMRPVFIYGKTWQGIRPTFLHWVKNNLEQNKPIKVVSDQQRTPTFVTDICFGLYQIMLQNAIGIYHFAGNEILSPYNMAITVAQQLGLNQNLIENVTSQTFVEPVARAKKSGLLITKAVKNLGYNPTSFIYGVQQTFGL